MHRHRRLSTFITQMKLVSGFVLFGLLIGYGSLMTDIVLSGRHIIRDVNSMLLMPMAQSLEDGRIESVEDIKDRIEEITGHGGVFDVLFPEGEPEDIAIRVYGKVSGAWEDLSDRRAGELDGETVMDLEKALERSHRKPLKIYAGREDRLEWMIRLSPEGSNIPLVLEASVHREGFRGWIESQREMIAAYTILLIVLSYLLGLIFAKRQSKPLTQLSERAGRIAAGEYDVRFPLDRLDEIGQVARNLDTMAVSLNHRVKTMTTMNRIDRAVLGVKDGTELTDRVAGFISEQFGEAGVCILAMGENGLHGGLEVVGRAPGNGEVSALEYDDIPLEIRRDYTTQAFLKKDGLELLGRLLPEGRPRSRGIRIPLFVEDRPAGIVMVSLDDVTDLDWDALAKLTDQVGVALQHQNQRRKRDALYRGSLQALSATVDAKSFWTAGHSERVARISIAVAGELGLDEETMNTVEIGSKFHDIGKISIDESILDKPGKLTDEEFEIVKQHPVRGAEIVRSIPEFEMIEGIILHHHERWDGTGYPDGLEKDAIPLLARLVCIADVYEAVTADRPYRKGKSPEEARDFMLSQEGTLFDPGILAIFIALFDSGRIPA